MTRSTLQYLLLLATTLCFACSKNISGSSQAAKGKSGPTKSLEKMQPQDVKDKIKTMSFSDAEQFVSKVKNNLAAKLAALYKASKAADKADKALGTAVEDFKNAVTAYGDKAEEALENWGKAHKSCLDDIRNLNEKLIKILSLNNNDHRRSTIASIEQILNSIPGECLDLGAEKKQLSAARTKLESAEKNAAAKKATREAALEAVKKAQKNAKAADDALKAKDDDDDEDDDD